MTLDFFESPSATQKGHDSPHTRQLKEFVFIQQQNQLGDNQWWKKEIVADFGLSKDEMRKMQAKDAKTKKAIQKANKANNGGFGADLLNLDIEDEPEPLVDTPAKSGFTEGQSQLDNIFSEFMGTTTGDAKIGGDDNETSKTEKAIAAAKASEEDYIANTFSKFGLNINMLLGTGDEAQASENTDSTI